MPGANTQHWNCFGTIFEHVCTAVRGNIVSEGVLYKTFYEFCLFVCLCVFVFVFEWGLYFQNKNYEIKVFVDMLLICYVSHINTTRVSMCHVNNI